MTPAQVFAPIDRRRLSDPETGRELSLYTVTGGAFRTNSYVLVSESLKRGVIIDAGVALAQAWDSLDLDGIEIREILLTHGHYDHIDGLEHMTRGDRRRAFAHRLDLELVAHANVYAFGWGWPMISVPAVTELPVNDIATGVGSVTWRHAPGHTPGSVCFGIGDALFTGDILFRRESGRTDLPGGDAGLLRKTIAGLRQELPPKMQCYPGHGRPFSICEVEFSC